ncbi:DUF1523 family protein [Roseobacter sp. YSTF-M11]|uniref:DUF1523 family protein n=1 Tax=Roseobacter insulae TaxID=2859783 RepID=A0A9X1FWQ0_9RHOB|nr:DUF1523 family protein [Roseobacter insulae]MBW4709042.1 DUF1523 family protein [Roseobacter insulae]
MAFFKWTFWTLFWVFTATAFHYTLPQTDIVRVTGTEIIRKDFSGFSRIFYAQADSGDNETQNRDLRLINTTRGNGRVMVYRNEDTGWRWPPYFKFDSSNLQAEASEFISTYDKPRWIAVRHYGWRNPFFSIYTNAIGFRAVDGPDAGKGFPVMNTLILCFFFGGVLTVWKLWHRFRTARIAPIMADFQGGVDAAGKAVASRRSRLNRWLDTWRAK